MSDSNRIRHLLLLFFFLTGLTGLIYELVWTRMLILSFGSTQFAITTVITTYMAGLALGSIIFGRFIDRFPRPMLIYGIIELLIGTYCFITPYIFNLIKTIYITSASVTTIVYASFNSTQFILSFFGIILPTTLMGGTLPVLIKFFTLEKDSVGKNTGLLYGLNTIGAVTGTLSTGLFLLYFFGVQSSLYLAGAIDTIIGLILIFLSTRNIYLTKEAEMVPTHPRQDESLNQQRSLGGLNSTELVIITSFALSGFAALAYEVLWTRLLSLVLGSSIYAFTIILTAFLTGISIGSLIYTRLFENKGNPLLLFSILESAIGLYALSSIFFYRYLPFIFHYLYNYFSETFWIFLVFQFMLSLIIMIVPTLAMGAIFPIVSKIYTKDSTRVGSSIGSLYFANTLGSIGGSFIAGFLMIPIIGIQRSIISVSFLNIAIAIALLMLTDKNVTLKSIKSSSVIAFSLIIVALLPSWDREVMTLGPYVNPELVSKYSDEAKDTKLLYYKEGINAVITVRKKGSMLSYQANGKWEARVNNDIPSEAWYLLGHIPMLLNKDPKNVLLIGLGSGITLGALEEYPAEQVEVVELEPAVIEAARFFSATHNNALDDKRLSIHITDGRSFIASTDRIYDVIVSGVSDPWITGVSNLFTREYFKAIYDHLAADGVVAIWFQNYRMTDSDFNTGLKTIMSVFPYVSTWFHYKSPADIIVVATKKRIQFDLDVMRNKLLLKRVHKGLMRIDIDGPYDIFEFFLAGTDDLRRLVKHADINTDNKPILEFSLPRHLYSTASDSHDRILRILSFLDNPIPPVAIKKDDKEWLKDFYINLGKIYYIDTFRAQETIDVFKEVLEIDPNNPLAKSYIDSLKNQLP